MFDAFMQLAVTSYLPFDVQWLSIQVVVGLYPLQMQ